LGQLPEQEQPGQWQRSARYRFIQVEQTGTGAERSEDLLTKRCTANAQQRRGNHNTEFRKHHTNTQATRKEQAETTCSVQPLATRNIDSLLNNQGFS
jgi:hypothetical protein